MADLRREALRRGRLLANRVRDRWRGAPGPAGWLVHRDDARRARRGGGRRSVIERVLDAFAEQFPDAAVLVVGANDGITRDPVWPHLLTRDWTAWLLEPVPTIHAQLKRNMRRVPGAVPVNMAIAETSGTLPFWTVRAPQPGETTWPWYYTLGSFNRDVVLSHTGLIPEVAERLVETKVAATTLPAFLAERRIDRIDLLVTDAEGHDLEVLRQLPFEEQAPAVIVYEHHHLDDDDRRIARDLLASHGYRWHEEGLDTVAVRTTGARPAPAEAARLLEEA